MYDMKNIYMLLAGWEVHTGKNCDQGLENAFSNPSDDVMRFETKMIKYSCTLSFLPRVITFLSSLSD